MYVNSPMKCGLIIFPCRLIELSSSLVRLETGNHLAIVRSCALVWPLQYVCVCVHCVFACQSDRLQKELTQKESDLRICKKDYLVSQRRLEEETDKVTESQLKASKLASTYSSQCRHHCVDAFIFRCNARVLHAFVIYARCLLSEYALS